MTKDKNRRAKDREVKECETRNYAFSQNRECEHFPCHNVEDPENFNCLFCYCPLYALGDECGGNFKYTDNGIKDCSDCTIPHRRDSYDYVTGKCRELIEHVRKK